eukprot:755644-Hanusia_phi.AAC.3
MPEAQSASSSRTHTERAHSRPVAMSSSLIGDGDVKLGGGQLGCSGRTGAGGGGGGRRGRGGVAS